MTDGKTEFQDRVKIWLSECFGPAITADRVERQDRFLEEVLELLQSFGYPLDRISALIKYVYGRPVGEPRQELGGVMVTLAALCQAVDLDMHDAGEAELARILQPEILAKIRAKQAAKPTGSALPIAAYAANAEPEGLMAASASAPQDGDLRVAAQAVVDAWDTTSSDGVHWRVVETLRQALYASSEPTPNQGRNDTLEEIISWHEAMIQSGHCGEENAEIFSRQRRNRHHQESAQAIRAMRTLGPSAPAELPGLRLALDIVKNNVEGYGRDGKYLLPRGEGNTMGLGYVDAIRAEIDRLTAKGATP